MTELAIPGLHEAVFRVVTKFAPPPLEALDLGAGTGAWSNRLRSAGYRVVAIERDAKVFGASAIDLISADLNEPFANHLGTRRFDLITCLEVIEHVENPRHLLRESRRLLKPLGCMVVSTPNVECIPGRLRFLATGELRMFGRDPTRSEPTHISPIHTLMFERMLADTELELVEHTFNASEPVGTKGINRFASMLVRPVISGTKGGDCHIFVLRSKTLRTT